MEEVVMRVFPPAFEVDLEEGFSPERDLFGRAPIAKGLSQLVGRVDQPLVIAIDGAWGSGKTTFLRFWTGELKRASFPVVFFDAFQNDYVDDAFIALAGEVFSLVEENKKDASGKAKKFAKTAVGAGKVLLRSGLKVGVKVATMGALSTSDIQDFADTISDGSSEAIDATIGEMITKQSSHRSAIEEFKKSLSELPALLAPPQEDGVQKPLIFIIDELDRCKPAFALELLERVKHFFSVPNVHFVLGVNSDQLCSSVRAVYGNDIDARLYLQKFIHLTWSLAKRERHAHDRSRTKYVRHLIDGMNFSGQDRETAEYASLFVGAIAEERGYSFRTIERALALISIAVATTPENQLRISPIIGGLALMKVLEPPLFTKAKEGKISYKEILSFLPLEELKNDRDGNWSWAADWWQFVSDHDAPEELIQEMRRGLFSYNIDGRLNLVSYTADTVMDNISLR